MVTFRRAVVEIATRVEEGSLRAATGAAAALTRGFKAAEAAGASVGKSLGATYRSVAGGAVDLMRKVEAYTQAIAKNRTEIRRLSAQERDLTARRRELRNEQGEISRSLRSLRAEIKRAGVATKEQAAAEAGLARVLAQTDAELRDNAAKTNDLAAARSRLAAQTDRLRAREEDLKRSAEGPGRVRAAAGRVAGRAAEGVRSAGRRGLRAAAIGGAAGVAGIAAGLSAATRESIAFESAFADVRKVLLGTGAGKLDEGGLERLEADLVSMSTRLPVAADGLAEIAAAAGQAGIAGGELTRFTEFSAKGAVAFDADAGTVGEAAAKLRTGLGLTQDGVESLFGSINELSNNFAATAPEILELEKRVGAVAATAGFTAQETAALGTALIASGADAAIAATGVKNLATRLAAGAAATDNQREALTALGLDAEGVAKSLQVDASGTVLDLFERIAALRPEEQTAALTNLFTQESIGAIGPLLKNLDTFRGALDVANDSARAAKSIQEEYNTRAATTANTLQLAKNAAAAFGITLGNELAPTVDKIVKLFADLVGGGGELATTVGERVNVVLQSLLERFQEIAADPEALGERIASLVEGFLALVDVVLQVLDVGASLVDNLGGTTTAVVGLTLAVGAAAGPWGLLAAAIVATSAVAGNAIADLLADVSGLTDEIERLQRSTAKSLAEAAKAKSEIDRIIAEDDARDAERDRERAARREGFTGFLAKGGENNADTLAQISVNDAIEREVRALQASGAGELDVAAARKAASEAFFDFEGGGGTDIAAAEEAARGALRAQVEASKIEEDRAKAVKATAGRQSKGRTREDKLAGIPADVRAIIEPELDQKALASGRLRRRDGDAQSNQLDRGVLASLRGSGIATGGGGSAAGPNVVQNITNNNVEITVNVDAKGAPAGVAERAREGGQAGAQAVDRIVNGQLAMTKLRNGAGRR